MSKLKINGKELRAIGLPEWQFKITCHHQLIQDTPSPFR
jgi:hypothetical protein